MTGPFGRVPRRVAERMGFAGGAPCTCAECRDAGLLEPSIAERSVQRSDTEPMCEWLHGEALKRYLELKAELERRVRVAHEATRF